MSRGLKKPKTVRDKVNELIADNRVMVFSKDYCGFCHKAMGLLRGKGIKYHHIAMDKEKDGNAIHNVIR